MVIVVSGLNIARTSLAGSNLLGTGEGYIAIGTGSQTMVSGLNSLVDGTDRNQVNTIDLTTNEQATFIANWSPPEISGTILTEFGLSTTGSVFMNIETLTGSQVFDGEQELQIQQTIKFFI